MTDWRDYMTAEERAEHAETLNDIEWAQSLIDCFRMEIGLMRASIAPVYERARKRMQRARKHDKG